MDMINLIATTPGLLDSLKSLGLTSDQMAMIGGELTHQLRYQGEYDLTALIKSMDVKDFAKRVDVDRVSGSTDINRDQVQAAVDMLAPAVEDFGLDKTHLIARMGAMTSGLFKPSLGG